LNEESFRNLVSGERRGPGASLARGALSVASAFYGCGVRIRNQLFDRGYKRVHRAPVPIISVGNITAGGTGKTPFVAYLAGWFTDRDVKVGLLSRGYRAHFPRGNDEKLVLDQLCPGVPHIQDKNRVAAARRAHSDHECELLILDDGFQHRRLARDLDIVLIDAMNPWGYGHLLPRGLLREPITELQRADLVVITRVDQCSDEQIQRIRDCLRNIGQQSECVEVVFRPRRLVNSDGQTQAAGDLKSKPIAAFCGIGNPSSFRRTLDDLGFNVAIFDAFPDHCDYTQTGLKQLVTQARNADAHSLICTQKDLVKINVSQIDDIPIWAVEIAAELKIGKELLEQKLSHVSNM